MSLATYVSVERIGFITCAFYWLCSAGILWCRARLPVCQEIVQYGGRALQPMASQNEKEKVGEDGAPLITEGLCDHSARRRSRGAAHSWSRHIRLTVADSVAAAFRKIRSSFLGTTRVGRQQSFCAFYAVGLVVSIALLLTSRTLQCCERAADQSARTHLGLPLTRMSYTKPDAFLRSRLVNVRLPSKHERSWSADRAKVLKEHADVRYSPFANVRNLTLAKAAVALYDEDLRQCVSMLGPLRYLELLPLIAFGLHCFVRLLECVVLQRFRTGDTITLFALLAGCSFYIFGAWSSHLGLLQAWREQAATASLQSLGLLLPENPKEGDSVQRLTSFLRERKAAAGPLDGRQQLPGVLGTMEKVSYLFPLPVPQAILFLFFILHLTGQLFQAVHHDVLAALRRRPMSAHVRTSVESVEAGIRAQRNLEERIWPGYADTKQLHAPRKNSTVTRNLRTQEGFATQLGSTAPNTAFQPPPAMQYDRRVLHYHFPNVSLFQWVLEPHYVCEIAMYFANIAMIAVLMWFGFLFVPGALHDDAVTLLPYYTVSGSLEVDAFLAILLQIATPIGLLLFTTFNLGLTAVEHRQFWNFVNTKREALRMILPPTPVEKRPPAAAPGPKLPLPEAGKDECLPSNTSAQEEEPINAFHVAQLRHVPRREVALRREIIPDWNFVPYVW